MQIMTTLKNLIGKARPSPVPAVPCQHDEITILVHGGSWYSGSPSDMAAYVPFMPGDVVNVKYTLLPKTTVAGQIGEIASVIKAAKQTHRRVYIVGYSAGAHLAVLAARRESVTALVGVSSPINLAAVSGLEGVSRIARHLDPYREAAHDATHTLLLHGDDDPLCKLRGVQAYAAKAKDVRLEHLAGIGHNSALILLFQDIIDVFLKEAP